MVEPADLGQKAGIGRVAEVDCGNCRSASLKYLIAHLLDIGLVAEHYFFGSLSHTIAHLAVLHHSLTKVIHFDIQA